MARTFIRGSDPKDTLFASLSQQATLPMTMSAWFRRTDDATNSTPLVIMAAADAAFASRYYAISTIRYNAVDKVLIADHTRGGAGISQTTTFWTVGEWHHAVGVFASTTSRTAYLDGIAAPEDTTSIGSVTSSNPIRSIAARYASGVPGFEFDGGVAEPAAWNVALTPQEIQALASGVAPHLIRPSALRFYAPLLRDEDHDRVGGLQLTANGSPGIAPHPRVYGRRRPTYVLGGVPTPPPVISGTYARATAQYDPTATISQHTFFIDGSNFDGAWWANATTDDGTKGRVTLDDGTVLAADWIAFDRGTSTVVIACLLDGDWNPGDTLDVRVFAPIAERASVAPGDPGGQYAAYDAGHAGYWPLVSDFNDRTSNGNNGTPSGGVTAGGATGVLGAATVFDGTDDYVDVGAGSSLEQPSAITLVALSKPDNTGQAGKLVGKWDSVGSALQYLLQHSGTFDKSLGAFSDSGVRLAFSSLEVVNSDWHMRTATWSSAAAYAWEDTSKGASATTGTTLDAQPSTPVYIGAGKNGTGTDSEFDGLIQHVSIHSSERSDDWITARYQMMFQNAAFWGPWTTVQPGGNTLLDDLSAHYGLDEAAGAVRADSHTNALDLTESGAQQIASVPGKINNAAQLVQADNSSLARPSADALLSLQGGFHMAAWITPGASTSRFLGMYGAGIGNSSWLLSNASGRFNFVANINNGTRFDAQWGSAFVQGSTYFVEAWYDQAANQIGICIDRGTDVVTTVDPGDGIVGTNKFQIGRDAANAADQVIDEVGIWQQKLSDADRDALYNGGAALAYSEFQSS